MSKWSCDKMIVVIKDLIIELQQEGRIKNVPIGDITLGGVGGGHDTEAITVPLNESGESLFVTAFSEEDIEEKEDRSNLDKVYFVELTDGRDSSGGYNGNNLDDSIIYQAIKLKLEENWEVANHYHDYL